MRVLRLKRVVNAVRETRWVDWSFTDAHLVSLKLIGTWTGQEIYSWKISLYAELRLTLISEFKKAGCFELDRFQLCEIHFEMRKTKTHYISFFSKRYKINRQFKAFQLATRSDIVKILIMWWCDKFTSVHFNCWFETIELFKSLYIFTGISSVLMHIAASSWNNSLAAYGILTTTSLSLLQILQSFWQIKPHFWHTDTAYGSDM